MPNNIPITELDFFAAKTALKNYLKNQNQFQDYDFDGSNMSVLLDVLSYNTYMNNFYTNMAYNEMFLDTAQTRQSIISHAKELNYLPRSCISSSAIVQIDFTVNDAPSFIIVPKGTKFTGRSNNTRYTFSTDESHTAIQIDGRYCIPDVSIYEGKLVTEYFDVVAGSEQRFILKNSDIDVSSLAITVRDSSTPGSKTTEYLMKDNIFGVSSVDTVYYVQPNDSDNYEISFGKNTFGKQPSVGNVVVVTYRVSSKDLPNGIRNFTSENIAGYPATVTTLEVSEGGADRETDESIRFFAPKSIQIQDRAITETDYEVILKNQFPEIQAISVYGGEELDPPRYGNVVVAVDVKNADGVSDNNKTQYSDYLKERCPIGISPIVISPEFMFLSVVTDVYYNVKTTDATTTDITSLVSSAILKYSHDNLSDFRKTFRFSKLGQYIDSADVNILSNNTSVRAIIGINPSLNINTNYDLLFKNKLINTHFLEDGELLSEHRPAIQSSPLTYGGFSGYIMDDGIGNLHIIKPIQSGKLNFLKRNIGTVDYETGRVIIKNLNITSYNGSEIKIYARTYNNDITAPKNRIISIREQDMLVSVIGSRV